MNLRRWGAVCLLGCAAGAHAMQPAAGLRLPGERIAAAEEYSNECGGRAFIVMQGGTTLRESYARGGGPSQPVWVMSITKNLAALAVFAARADGLLELDEPAAKTLEEWRDHPRKSRITIRELLDQTSGLATGYPTIYSSRVRDKNRFAVDLAAIYTPGTQFDYAPGNFEIIEEILRRKLAPRGETPFGYLRRKVLTPLGIQPADWRRDRSGNHFFSAGAKLTARDVAKIGEFIRTKGRMWILPALPVSAFEGAFTGSKANSMYGLSFWLNANARREGAEPISVEGTLGQDRSPAAWRRSSLSATAPEDLVAMIGSGGLRCYIVPSRKLVIVRFGTGSNFSDAKFLAALFGR